MGADQFLRLLNSGTRPRFTQTYLYRTARNLAIDHVRAQQRRGDNGRLPDEQEIADHRPSPERDIAGRQELDIVRQAIEELPPKCRLVFIKLRFEEKSFRQISEEMALSDRMVRKYAARALEHCMARLREARDAG